MRAVEEEEARGEGKGEAIPMRRMRGTGGQRPGFESSDEEEAVDETFELPRLSDRMEEDSEQELYDPPEGRRRRGEGRQARSMSYSLSDESSPPRSDSEDGLTPPRVIGDGARRDGSVQERRSSGRPRRSRSRGREASDLV